ncbi:MAG: hypothetical protein AB1714_03175 [Acidobacteriota bacterium]
MIRLDEAVTEKLSEVAERVAHGEHVRVHRNHARVRHYLTRSKRQEVDFLVSDQHGRPIQAVQVSMDISLPDTLRREIEPLVTTASYFGTRDNLVITMNQEQRIESDGVVVHAVPAWRWLLGGTPFAP